MADRLTIARPYAKAAFRTAVASSRLGPASQAIAAGALAVADERVKNLLGSPKVTAAQLAQLFCELTGPNDGIPDPGYYYVHAGKVRYDGFTFQIGAKFTF